MKFIVYENRDEILITTPELEEQMLKEWSTPDREFDENNLTNANNFYERSVVEDTAVSISSSLRFN